MSWQVTWSDRYRMSAADLKRRVLPPELLPYPTRRPIKDGTAARRLAGRLATVLYRWAMQVRPGTRSPIRFRPD